jgi:hypothetical protein
VGTAVVEEAKVRRRDKIAVGEDALRERAWQKRRHGLGVDQLEYRRRLPSQTREGRYSNDQEKQSCGAPGNGIAGHGHCRGCWAGRLLIIIP